MSGGYRCPLGALQPVPMDTERIKADAWKDDGILVVRIEDSRLSWVEAQQLRQIGDKLDRRVVRQNLTTEYGLE